MLSCFNAGNRSNDRHFGRDQLRTLNPLTLPDRYTSLDQSSFAASEAGIWESRLFVFIRD